MQPHVVGKKIAIIPVTNLKKIVRNKKQNEIQISDCQYSNCPVNNHKDLVGSRASSLLKIR